MATQLSRTFSSQGNQRKFTISVWVKRSNLTAGQSIFGSGGSGNYATNMYFSTINELQFWNYFGGAYAGYKYSSAVFRDTSAWYHIVFRVDTTSATASERMRIYVNGEEISYSTSSDPGQNQTMEIGHTGAHYIGGYGTGAQAEMCMSHFHYCDGQSYAPTEFGEYDTNGVWKIKNEPSVSYGVSGHFLFNNDASVTDQSGLGNNWSTSGTLTQTEDNPSNVFATLNPLDKAINGTLPTFAYGNTQWTASGNSTSNNAVRGTLGNSNGKYYFEAKLLEATNTMIGVHLTSVSPFYDGDGYMGSNSGFYGIYINDTDNISARVAGSSGVSGLGSVTNNDIIGCAFDFDNNKFYFSKNGTWLNSGDPTSGATGTGSFGTLASGLYVPGITNVSWTVASSTAFNFGNGYFGTTAVASAGTNASGIGIFEYDVPTGYTALSTKGLNL